MNGVRAVTTFFIPPVGDCCAIDRVVSVTVFVSEFVPVSVAVSVSAFVSASASAFASASEQPILPFLQSCFIIGRPRNGFLAPIGRPCLP